MKKILLTLLAVFMFATAGTANVLADTTTGNDIYVSFGDSITRGLGSQPDKTTEECEASDENIRIVKGAYNTLVADYLGFIANDATLGYYPDKYYKDGYRTIKTNYLPVAGYGLTVADALKLLAGETEDLGWRGIDVFGTYGKGKAEDVAAAITKAKSPLITVNLGLMDVGLYSSADEEFQGEMAEIFKAAGGNTEQALLSIIPAYEKAMFKAYTTWATNYDKLISQLTKLNKKADVVLVGFFNPLRGVNYKVSLGEDKGYILLPIGIVLDPIIGLMNETTRFIAKKYNVKYADVSNGEGMNTATEEAINDLVTGDDLEFAIHGTADTYYYMSRQIIAAIDDDGSIPTKDLGDDYRVAQYGDASKIVVDLIRATAPTDANYGYVDENGEPVSAKDIDVTVLLDGKKATIVPSPIDDKDLRFSLLTVENDGETDHKLLQVFLTTYGTADDEDEGVLYTKVDVATVYAETFDKEKFEADQKDGKIVKLDAKGNPDVKYHFDKDFKLEVVPQTLEEGDVWVECKIEVVDNVEHGTFEPVLAPTEYEFVDAETFKADQKAGIIVRNNTTDITKPEGKVDHTIWGTIKPVEKYDEADSWVVATPKTDWLERVTGATPVYTTKKADLTKYTLLDGFDSDTFKADQKAGKIVRINDEGKPFDKNGVISNDGSVITIATTDRPVAGEVWVKSEAKKNGYGEIVAITPKTVTKQVQNKEIENIEVRTYLLAWRGDHYEAYSIDSTNSVEARVEKILSPITEPIAKAKADIEKWYTDWYNHTDFAPYLDQFALSIEAYNDAKDAVTDADDAIKDAQDAVTVAQEKETYARQALEKAINTPGKSITEYTKNVNDAKDAYKAAQEATKEAKAAVTAAQKDAVQARLDVLPTAGDAVKKGIEYAQSASKWAWNYATHLN